MQELLVIVFDLALLPFTSGSALVIIPAMFAFIYGCVSLVFSLVRAY